MRMRPRIPCTVAPTVGFDKFGQEQLGNAVSTKCTIISLSLKTGPTSVRTDSSASRGSSQEKTSEARILLAPGLASMNAKVEVSGRSLRIMAIDPRYTMGGTHDHDEVDLVVWA